MSTRWDRKREPDSVPTPVAIALSDYCRRAQSPAAATDVRAALSVLNEEEDFRIRELAESEPEARPLGPWAVIDVLGGTSPALAAQRQSVGYYELAQALSEEKATKAPPPAPVPVGVAAATLHAPSPAVELPSEPPPTRAEKRQKEKAVSISERIAPRKRSPEEMQEALHEDPLPKRELPRGRGRFTTLAAQRAPAEELLAAANRDLLEGLLAQHPHRFALLHVLGDQFQSRNREDLSQADLERALAHHGLLESLERKERELVLGSYEEQRGATGRVAYGLNLRPGELAKLVNALALTAEVDSVRERFKREALAARNLTARLDLLGRTRYLADLGVEKKFREALRRDLEALLGRNADGAQSLDELAERAGRSAGAPRELILRAMEKLGLTSAFREQLGELAERPS